MSYTPGPWTFVAVQEQPSHLWRYWVEGSSMDPQGEFDNEADARLIAAAPELLEALEAVLSMDMAEALMLPSGAHPSAQLARAAIAKARGES